LLAHPGEASEMAVQARKTVVEQFDWRLVVQKVLKVYGETLKAK